MVSTTRSQTELDTEPEEEEYRGKARGAGGGRGPATVRSVGVRAGKLELGKLASLARGGGRRGTIRGAGARENPIVIVDTPRTAVTEGARKPEVKTAPLRKEERKATMKGKQGLVSHPITTPVTPEGGKIEEEGRTMPGQFDLDLTGSFSSVDPSPPPRPQIEIEPELVRAMREELTIGFIANEVPMEPVLAPEPATPKAATNTKPMPKGGEELELETSAQREDRMAVLVRQVEEEGRRHGEGEQRKEEEEMFNRVVAAVMGGAEAKKAETQRKKPVEREAER